MKRFLTFISQVATNWGALVSGGILIGGLFLWQGSGRQVQSWVFYAIAGLALLRATFKAWNDQVNRADEFEQRSKELEGRPDLVLTCELSVGRKPELISMSSHKGPYSFRVKNSGPGQAIAVSIDPITLLMSEKTLKDLAAMDKAYENQTGNTVTRKPGSDAWHVRFGTIASIPVGDEVTFAIKIENAGNFQKDDLYYCMENTVREETLVGTYRHPLALRFSNRDGGSWLQMYRLQHTFAGPLTLTYERIKAQ